MSHIHTRKAISVKNQYAGQKWWYQFRYLPKLIDEKRITAYSASMSQKFSEITKNWDDVRIPLQFRHPFRCNSGRCSASNQAPIPLHFGHPLTHKTTLG